MRHCIGQCMLTNMSGYYTAKKAGDWHEFRDMNCEQKKRWLVHTLMDLHNNEVARRSGMFLPDECNCVKTCENLWANGDLANPDTARKFPDFVANRERVFNDFCPRIAIRDYADRLCCDGTWIRTQSDKDELYSHSPWNGVGPWSGYDGGGFFVGF